MITYETGLVDRLLRLLRKERRTMLSLTSLGLTPGQSFDLLTHPAISATITGANVLDGLFDASDRAEDGGVIIWWNNFEKDTRYVLISVPNSIVAYRRIAQLSELGNVSEYGRLSHIQVLVGLLNTVSSVTSTTLPWPIPASQIQHIQYSLSCRLIANKFSKFHRSDCVKYNQP